MQDIFIELEGENMKYFFKNLFILIIPVIAAIYTCVLIYD